MCTLVLYYLVTARAFPVICVLANVPRVELMLKLFRSGQYVTHPRSFPWIYTTRRVVFIGHK